MPTPLRVGVVYPGWHMGGAERWLETLSDGMPADRVRVEWVRVPRNRITFPSSRVLVVEDGDPRGETEVDVLIVWASSLNRVPTGVPKILVSHCGDDEYRTRWTRRYVKDAAIHYDTLVAVSETARGAYLPEDRERVHVIFPPVDFSRVRPTMVRQEARAALGIPQEAEVVGYVGRFSGEKDAHATARAVWAMGENAYAVYCGRGWDDCTFKDGVERLIPGRVVWVPPRDDVGNVFAALDVHVLLGRMEAFGLATVEAWYNGVATVVAEGDLADPGRFPVVVARHKATSKEIASAVRHAMWTRDAGRLLRATEEFDPKVIGERWADVIEQTALAEPMGFVASSSEDEDLFVAGDYGYDDPCSCWPQPFGRTFFERTDAPAGTETVHLSWTIPEYFINACQKSEFGGPSFEEWSAFAGRNVRVTSAVLQLHVGTAGDNPGFSVHGSISERGAYRTMTSGAVGSPVSLWDAGDVANIDVTDVVNSMMMLEGWQGGFSFDGPSSGIDTSGQAIFDFATLDITYELAPTAGSVELPLTGDAWSGTHVWREYLGESEVDLYALVSGADGIVADFGLSGEQDTLKFRVTGLTSPPDKIVVEMRGISGAYTYVSTCVMKNASTGVTAATMQYRQRHYLSFDVTGSGNQPLRLELDVNSSAFPADEFVIEMVLSTAPTYTCPDPVTGDTLSWVQAPYNDSTDGLRVYGLRVTADVSTYVPAGGLVFGDRVQETHAYVVYPSGGLVYGGRAAFPEEAYDPDGGFAWGGSTTPTLAYLFTPAGGLVWDGSSDANHINFVTIATADVGPLITAELKVERSVEITFSSDL